jgi:hypothetical protein
MTKDKAAVSLGKKRWVGKSADEIHAATSAAGKARAASLSKKRRSQIAKTAAKARWGKKTSKPQSQAE